MSNRNQVDLKAIARNVMFDRGFEIEFSYEVKQQVSSAPEQITNLSEYKDLTALLWSSIDNDDSKDLDQIEYSEKILGGTRIYVGIADVVSLVPKNSPVDQHAKHNTTSVYTGVETFPMLPERFSTELTSLNEGATRLAFVVEMDISDHAEVIKYNVYRALVLNKAQLTYNGVSAWLDKTPPPYSEVTTRILEKINQNSKLQEQIIQQEELTQVLRKKRFENGALDFQTLELTPSISDDGRIDLQSKVQNRASHIIEEFMIASNQVVDAYLESKSIPHLQRVVRTPKNWSRMVELAAQDGGELPPNPDGKALQKFLADRKIADPDHFADLSLAMIKLLGRGEYVVKRSALEGLGHFGLAATNYSHTTAPNRRYPDLITQRLLESAISYSPAPYSDSELEGLAVQCTTKEDDANKAERRVKKSIAAVALSSSIGKIFDGLITGMSDKGTFVRVSSPPVEGKIDGSTKGLDVGDRVTVRLSRTDPYKGFIDFVIVRE